MTKLVYKTMPERECLKPADYQQFQALTFGSAILILRVSQSCASSSLALARLTLGSDQIPPSGVCKR